MEVIHSDEAPAAVGHYSQAITANGFVFCSGQIALTKENELIEGGVEEQTKQILENMKAVLEAAGSSLSKAVRVTIFLTDMNDFAAVNEIYASYMGDHKPARAVIGVKMLPKGVAIEVDCIAVTA